MHGAFVCCQHGTRHASCRSPRQRGPRCSIHVAFAANRMHVGCCWQAKGSAGCERGIASCAPHSDSTFVRPRSAGINGLAHFLVAFERLYGCVCNRETVPAAPHDRPSRAPSAEQGSGARLRWHPPNAPKVSALRPPLRLHCVLAHRQLHSRAFCGRFFAGSWLEPPYLGRGGCRPRFGAACCCSCGPQALHRHFHASFKLIHTQEISRAAALACEAHSRPDTAVGCRQRFGSMRRSVALPWSSHACRIVHRHNVTQQLFNNACC